MPYHVAKSSECPASRPWAVVKDADGEVMGCHETREGAVAQIGAIESEEDEASMTAATAKRTLNDEFAAAREAGQEFEGALVAAYLAAIRKAGREAALRFQERAVLVAASNWVPPEVSDVMAYAVSGDRIRASQRQILGAIGQRITEIPGVSFDALMPPTQRQLEKLGLRAVALASDIRGPVADAIARAWAEGRSVTQAATLIRSVVNEIAPARAVMLARTDLISLSNGANQSAVGILNAAAAEAGEEPAVQSKTWLATMDNRTRPTHADADGQTVPIDQPYDVGGADLWYPGDPDGPDEEVINCRCTELYSDEAATSASTSELPEEAIVSSVTIDYGSLHRIATRRVSSEAGG